jgi:hypothetical protein
MYYPYYLMQAIAGFPCIPNTGTQKIDRMFSLQYFWIRQKAGKRGRKSNTEYPKVRFQTAECGSHECFLHFPPKVGEPSPILCWFVAELSIPTPWGSGALLVKPHQREPDTLCHKNRGKRFNLLPLFLWQIVTACVGSLQRRSAESQSGSSILHAVTMCRFC